MTDVATPPQHGRRGRLPRRPPELRFPLKWAHEYLLSFPTPTFPIDRTEGIVNLGMQDNNNWGDCVEAAEVHGEMTTAVASGVSFTPGPDLALQRAQQYAGFGTTPPGPGTDMPSYYQTLYEAKLIIAWAPVDLSNLPACYALMAAGFGIQIGVELYTDNELQFDQGQPFDATGGLDPSEGHAVLWAYSETATGPHKVGTWAIWEGTTHAWLEGACLTNPDGEGYLVVYTEEQAALFEPALLEDVQALSGTGPIPAPPPAPPAPPTPTPVPETWQQYGEAAEKLLTAAAGAMQKARNELNTANFSPTLTTAQHEILATIAGPLETEEAAIKTFLTKPLPTASVSQPVRGRTAGDVSAGPPPPH